MITWFPVRKQGLASTVETFCRFSTRRTSTGGRSVQTPAYFNHIRTYSTFFVHQLLRRKIFFFTGLFTHSVCVHVCVPSQACHIEGGSAGLIPSQLLEEKRKAFVKRDLELATTGTPLSSMQQSREALLIMQIRHRLLTAQTHRQQRQHLFLSISYKHFIWRRALILLSPLQSVTLSVSTGELVMSIVVTQAAWSNLLVIKLQGMTFTNSPPQEGALIEEWW